MLKVGITGGIGSGKSTVCKIFSHLGIPIYDSDSRSRWLQENNQTIILATKQLLGEDSYLENGVLNRNFISKKIFSDANLLQKLNQIVHPIVISDALEWFENQKIVPYAIKESALLFSANIYTDLDFTIAVMCPIEVRIKRILKRDETKTEQQILGIIEKQKPNEILFSKADFTVFNNENELLIPQILKIDSILKSKI